MVEIILLPNTSINYKYPKDTFDTKTIRGPYSDKKEKFSFNFYINYFLE